MVKLIVCVRRKAGLTREEFSAYWRYQHGPLVKSIPEFMRHVRKYVQCHLTEKSFPGEARFGALADYDGVGELWFDSPETMQQAFNELRYLEVIRPDELKFLDHVKCLSFLTDEVIMAED
ncbi:MAG: EthD domain-containing protein [Deltaproteobacteria bacterium]|nr:EthD domain-containing protein [Deltaproteobacteria bacterium]